ncbi:hypothetical protein LPJ59_001529 [Coemansia sp. RSA 2399]|nr:hypothetical protein LPJ59_001529 [Coemansia sp. RSA 2399]
MENLRTSVQRHAPSGTRYSVNDIICAYVTIIVVQAKEKASADWWSKPVPLAIRSIFGNRLSEYAGFQMSIAVSMRPRINNPDVDNYMGNMSFGKSIWFPQDVVHVEPVDKALSTLALRIHQAASSIDELYVSQLGCLLNSEPDSYMRLILNNAKQRRKLMISSQVRFAHYQVDFGAGSPTLVRLAPYAFPDVVFVMPGNPTMGGYELVLNLAPEVAINVVQNDSWMNLVDKYDCY